MIAILAVSFACASAPTPNPEVIGVTAKEKIGFAYGVLVVCRVRNLGAAGLITVRADLAVKNGGRWTKDTIERIAEGVTTEYEMLFSEPTFLAAGLGRFTYDCAAEAS